MMDYEDFRAESIKAKKELVAIEERIETLADEVVDKESARRLREAGTIAATAADAIEAVIRRLENAEGAE